MHIGRLSHDNRPGGGVVVLDDQDLLDGYPVLDRSRDDEPHAQMLQPNESFA